MKEEKPKMKTQVIVFMMLAIVFVALAISTGMSEYSKYMKLAKVNANANMDENQTEIEQNEITNNVIEQNTIEESKVAEKKIDEKKTKEKNEKEYEALKKKKILNMPTYFIKVNYGAQVVTIYKKDSNGKYTKPIKAMVCSTGTYTPTSGTYRTLAKGNWWGLYGDVYGQYATHIVDGILFHSVPYITKGDCSSLKYKAYDQLGSRVSMGCVRLTVADAKWIYDNCTIGTQVEFYSSSNPGPLGKPSAKKISNAPSNVRGWDPTDPNKNNPWPAYLKSLKDKDDPKKPTVPTEPQKPEKPTETPKEPTKDPDEGGNKVEENTEKPGEPNDNDQIKDNSEMIGNAMKS